MGWQQLQEFYVVLGFCLLTLMGRRDEGVIVSVVERYSEMQRESEGGSRVSGGRRAVSCSVEVGWLCVWGGEREREREREGEGERGNGTEGCVCRDPCVCVWALRPSAVEGKGRGGERKGGWERGRSREPEEEEQRTRPAFVSRG